MVAVESQSATNGHPVGPAASRVGVDIRSLIPKLGLREYWYPALLDKEVSPKKGTFLKLLGDDLMAFRGKSDKVVIVPNACPHRGAMLDHGNCVFPGFVTCFYHGYTFDENGECVAVLGEGPSSPMVGRVRTKVYPTITLKGIVFVWMGKGEPTEAEHGIPEDFFDPDVMICSWINHWDSNWRPTMENIDAHYAMIHKNAVKQLMRPFPKFGAGGRPYQITGHRMRQPQRGNDGQTTSQARPLNVDPRDYFPGVDSMWPAHNYRRLWTWMFAWTDKRRMKMSYPLSDEWGAGHHLPGMFRQNYACKVFTRWIMPVEENRTRLWYFHATKPGNALGRLYEKVHFNLFGNWLMNKNFSEQDSKGSVNAYHDTREHLSPLDLHTFMWRKFLLSSPELRAPSDGSGLEGATDVFTLEAKREAVRS